MSRIYKVLILVVIGCFGLLLGLGFSRIFILSPFTSVLAPAVPGSAINSTVIRTITLPTV